MYTQSNPQRPFVHGSAMALCALILLSGCSTARQGSPAAVPRCDAAVAQWAVGETISDSLANRIQLESRSTLVRRVRPGQPVTLDVRPDRLNIKLDENGRIESISCG